jgi:hypothetical protein
MLPTRNNVSIAAALRGVARAHLQYPGVDPHRVAIIAQQIENAVRGHATAEVTAALAIQLLRGIGAVELSDPVQLAREH